MSAPRRPSARAATAGSAGARWRCVYFCCRTVFLAAAACHCSTGWPGIFVLRAALHACKPGNEARLRLIRAPMDPSIQPHPSGIRRAGHPAGGRQRVAARLLLMQLRRLLQPQDGAPAQPLVACRWRWWLLVSRLSAWQSKALLLLLLLIAAVRRRFKRQLLSFVTLPLFVGSSLCTCNTHHPTRPPARASPRLWAASWSTTARSCCAAGARPPVSRSSPAVVIVSGGGPVSQLRYEPQPAVGSIGSDTLQPQYHTHPQHTPTTHSHNHNHTHTHTPNPQPTPSPTRAIEPCRGKWTVPAGFLELRESTMAGAARETLEETGAEVGRKLVG